MWIYGGAGRVAERSRLSMLSRQIVRTRHGQMHVRLAGEPGPERPLVLLHMSPVSGAMFEPVLRPLSRQRQVIAPDRLGFGASDRASHPLDIPRYALSTCDLLDNLAIERFDVLG